MKRTGLILLLFMIVIVTQLDAQKYVKYIFLENKLKMHVPFDLKEIKPLNEYQANEELPLIRAWGSKNKKTEMLVFLCELGSKSALEADAELKASQLSFLKNEYASIKSGIFRINNRQNAYYHKLLSGQELFYFIAAYFSDNQLLIITLKGDLKREKKSDAIIKELQSSLNVN